jgi:hypothetical protein
MGREYLDGPCELMKTLLGFFLFTISMFGQASGAGRIGGTGTQLFVTNAQTSTYQTLINDFQFCKTIPVASGTFTITLVASTAQPANGQCLVVLNYGAGVVTVAPSGQNINGSSSNQTVGPGSPSVPTGLWVISDGTNYEAQPLGVQATNLAPLFSCQILDNAICTSSVDASGNPNFLTTAAGTSLPINGGTTPLVMFIGGVYQQLTTNVTLTVPTTASVQQWILAKQDIVNGSMIAGDFLAMNTAPYYGYTAPTCPSPSPALSSTNPAFWFNLAANLSELCTSNGGSYSASVSMVIGTIYVNATPAVANILTEPYRLNGYRRFELFGNGSAGVLTVTSGTTTLDSVQQYQSVLVTAGTVTHSSGGGTVPEQTIGIAIKSQNPVMIVGTGAISANGAGRQGSAGTTGAGAAGASGGRGGAGGGGGGSTTATGGVGGGGFLWLVDLVTIGGTAGATTPTAGGNGISVNIPLLLTQYSWQCAGAPGGTGGGDGTNIGGIGGAGGGSIFVNAPSLLAASGTSITANGTVGGNGAAGNAAGGGGGGGGCVILSAGFLTTSASTITANGGTGGTGQGTGRNGGNGGAGTVQQNKLW